MKTLRRLGLTLVLALASAPAFAAPLQYVPLEGSQVNLSLWLNDEAISFGQSTLDGGSIVFDAETGELSSVSLATAASLYASALPGAFNSIEVSLAVASGEGGSLTSTFSGVLADINEPSTADPQAIEGAVTTDEVVTEVEVGDDGTVRIALRGVKLAELISGNDVFVIRGDIKIIGTPVPEPAAAAMLLSGIAGLVALGKRRA
jgi:hypothetical protein